MEPQPPSLRMVVIGFKVGELLTDTPTGDHGAVRLSVEIRASVSTPEELIACVHCTMYMLPVVSRASTMAPWVATVCKLVATVASVSGAPLLGNANTPSHCVAKKTVPFGAMARPSSSSL